MNYEVRDTDTIEGIAAAHDCTVGELVKLNRLPLRMVFPGQKLRVPAPRPADESASGSVGSALLVHQQSAQHQIDGWSRGGGTRSSSVKERGTDNQSPNPMVGLVERTQSDASSSNAQSKNITSVNNRDVQRQMSMPAAVTSVSGKSLDSEDVDCLQKFLKIRVKQVTESDGTVFGTLLVTPNCLMFDPETSHPLVQENGSDLYGMVANMEDIVSVCVYKQFGDLIGEGRNKSAELFDPEHATSDARKQIQLRQESIERKNMFNDDKIAVAKVTGSKATINANPVEYTGSDVKFISHQSNDSDLYGMSAGCLLDLSRKNLQTSVDEDLVDRLSASCMPTGGSNTSLASDQTAQLPSIEEEGQHGRTNAANAKAAAQDSTNGSTDESTSGVVFEGGVADESVYEGDEEGLSRKNLLNEPFYFRYDSLENKNLQNVRSTTSASSPSLCTTLSASQSELDAASTGSGGTSTRRSPSPSSPFSRYSPNMARRSFGKLGRTLSARVNSIKGTVASGAQTVASGTQKVAHGVVTHTRSAADHIQTGIQTSAKVVASVPGSIANVVHEGQTGVLEAYDSLILSLGEEPPERSLMAMKRERSLATLESLCHKTKQARELLAANNKDIPQIPLATDRTNALPPTRDSNVDGSETTPDGNGTVISTDSPYYMIVRVDRRRKRKRAKLTLTSSNASSVNARDCDGSFGASANDEDTHVFGNKRKREFWFAVPRKRVNAIYQFLLYWSPNKYGQEKASTADETNDMTLPTVGVDNALTANSDSAKGRAKAIADPPCGFIVLDAEVDDSLAGEKPSAESLGARHGANLNREWEVVTVRELCRRLSLKDSLEPSEMPLPKGALQSLILDEFMIRQIIDILPPRAEGYSWVNIYSSEKHGFSLSTLYRKMSEWTEEMSPVLLVIRDVNSHVFGAVASTALRPSEHYYGTGDSCLLFRFTGEYPHTRELRSYKWTGDNQFFVNATRNFLAMGGGSGHYGLWLDSDLNHGRSQRCATFDNEPLAGSTTSAGDVTPVALVDADNGNFIVQYIEAFGFSMS